MPEGPNKSEERLQRYAKERRGRGGDFAMHPATRRLLQGEVMRQYGTSTKEERSWLQWFGLWRGRFVLGTGVAAVVATGVWILVQNQNRVSAPMKLAKANVSAPADGAVPRNAEFESRFGGRTEAEATPAPARAMEEKTVALKRAKTLNDEVESRRKESSVRGDRLSLAQTKTNLAEQLSELYSVQPASTNANWGYTVSLTPVEKFAPAENGAALAPSGVSASDLRSEFSSLTVRSRFAAPRASNGVAARGGMSYGLATNSAMLAGGSRFYEAAEGTPQTVFKNVDVRTTSRLPEAAKEQQNRQLALGAPATESLDRARPAPVTAPAAAAPAGTVATFGDAAIANKLTEQQLSLRANDAPAPTANSLRTETGAEKLFFFRQVSAVAENEALKSKGLAEDISKKSERAQSASAVLDHFTVEERGKTIRIIEPDGSIYEGVIDVPLAAQFAIKFDSSAARDKDLDGLVREQVAGLKEAKAEQGQSYSFRASGTNVTLKQLVVVNGRFTQETNSALLAERGIDAAKGVAQRRATAPPAVTAPAQTATAVGAAIGGTNVATNPPMVLEGIVRIGATNVQRLKAVSGAR